MHEVTKKLRLQEWARQVDDWQASGMTQKNWCRIHGIGYDAFKYRKAKVEKYAAELMREESTSIIPVDIAKMESAKTGMTTSCGQTMEIHLEKATVRISNSVDVVLLKSALEVLANAENTRRCTSYADIQIFGAGSMGLQLWSRMNSDSIPSIEEACSSFVEEGPTGSRDCFGKEMGSCFCTNVSRKGDTGGQGTKKKSGPCHRSSTNG